MGIVGKIICLVCLFISSCSARSVIQQVTQGQGSDEPKQDLIVYKTSSEWTILGDEPTPSYTLKTNLGVTRTLRDQAPSSYLLKIENFSELKSKPPNYESAVFDAAGYKWRLIFYPNGNENDGGRDHLSLYLRIEKTDSLPKNWQVDVDLKLFVHNQPQNKYLAVQDGTVKRFNEAKKEWGYVQLLPLSTFNNPSNGYLVNDGCSIGVEIFVIKPPEKRETLSFIRKPADGKFTWKIFHLSKLDQFDYHSADFQVGERNWKIAFHPKGCMDGTGNSLSMWLMGWGYPPSSVEVKTYAWAKLRLLNQRNSNHIERETGGWYQIYPYIGYGFPKFISLKDLYDQSKGYLVDDKIILEVEIQIVSVTKVFSN